MLRGERSSGAWAADPIDERGTARAGVAPHRGEGGRRSSDGCRTSNPGRAREDARGWRRLVAPILVVAGRVGSDAVGILAGSLTYGAFLSLPPLLMVMLSITGAVLKNDPAATQDVLDAVANVIPGLSTMVNTSLNVQTAQQIGIGVVGAIAVLWSASGFAARARNAFGTDLPNAAHRVSCSAGSRPRCSAPRSCCCSSSWPPRVASRPDSGSSGTSG